MSSSLLKYFIYSIVLLTTSITYANNKKRDCRHGFTLKKPPTHINKVKKDLRTIIKNNGSSVLNRQTFEKMASNIVHDREFVNAINKKKINDRNQAWADVEDTIVSIFTEKHIMKKIMSAIIEQKLNKKSIIDNVIQKQTQSNNKQLYTEFVGSYFNNPLFREWIYKRTMLNELQDIIDTSVTRIDRLDRTLLDEVKQSSWATFFETESTEIPQWRTNILTTIEEVHDSNDL